MLAAYCSRGRRPRLLLCSNDFRLLRSEEHTSELQSQSNLVCRLLLEKKNTFHSLPPSARPIYCLSPVSLCRSTQFPQDASSAHPRFSSASDPAEAPCVRRT